jgi:hypothetical protein
MNGAQLHLLINHLPVLLPVIGATLIGFGILLASTEHKRIGAWLLVVSALSVIPVYLTGDPAEHIVKNYPEISRLLIHDHENSALLSLIALEITGVASLLLLYDSYYKTRFSLKIRTWIALLLLSLISFVFIARTAHLGGLIRHEEIRNGDRF